MDPARAHVLTIQLEDYYQVAAFRRLIPSAHWTRFEARVVSNAERVLHWLDETGNRATFFTCGWLAERYPRLLAGIAARGHEVACQGWFNHAIADIPPPAFRDELRRARAAVEDAAGVAVRGFRTGRGWLGRNDLWVLDVLAEEGLRYDSSLSPIGRDFAGEPGRGVIHRHRAAVGELWEVPVSSLRIAGCSWPISGGNYVRQFPDRLMRRAMRRWIATHDAPFVFYFHVWEVDPDQPVITAAPRLQHVRHYRNLHAMPARIRSYLQDWRFQSIAQALVLEQPASAAPPPSRATAAPADAGADTAVRTELTVVVPCYNEADALPYLARTLREFEREAPFELHLVLVDDGSEDGTWQAMHTHFGEHPRCALLRHERNRGISAGVLTGVAAATTACVAVLDADCTFDPAQLPGMHALLTDGVDVVVASPLHREGGAANVPAWRMALSRGAAFLYQRVMRNRLTSYTSCFRIYRRDCVAHLSLDNPGFSGMAEILAHLDVAGRRIVEYPAVLETRLLGRSKINTLRTIGEHLHLIARLAAARWLNRPFGPAAPPSGHA